MLEEGGGGGGVCLGNSPPAYGYGAVAAARSGQPSSERA